LRILLLQGPVGGFFTYLHRHLEHCGFQVRRLVFNAGDLVFACGSPHTEVVRGRPPVGFEAYFRDQLAGWRPDAVLLFGDRRPVHMAAIQAAKALDVPVWSFEEGYVRPYHVAFEVNGNNAGSPARLTFDRSVSWPEPEPPPTFRSHTLSMAGKAIAYFIALRTFRIAFPGYVHHRERHLRSEVRVWLRSFATRFRRRRSDARLMAAIRAAEFSPFFTVALQVHDDLQLRYHGGDWRVPTFLEAVIRSFAAHAPKHVRLLIKLHPLDVGYAMATVVTQRLTAELGLGDRIAILCAGAVSRVIASTAGVVTINSTVGLQALKMGTPVLALGHAIYHVDGLPPRPDTLADLDRFWAAPPPVDTETAARFVTHLTRHALLAGSFYLPETWTGLVDQVTERLHTALTAGSAGHGPPTRGRMEA
jgi:capsular polysaccharide export protein